MIPNIPSLSSQISPEVRRAFDALRGWFTSIEKAGGLATLSDVSAAGGGGSTTIIYQGGGGGGGTEPAEIPMMGQPTGFVVAGAFSSIILTWDQITSPYFAHMEVWRATVNDIGQAVIVGSSPGVTFADVPPNSLLSITYYYWIRAVNTANLPGPYNATAGTAGTTADDPAYVLELLLDSKWKPSTGYALGAYVYPTKPNGYAYKVTTAGDSSSAEPTWTTTIGSTVADGSVVFTCDTDMALDSPFMIGLVNGVVRMVIRDTLIGDATITSAKIKELAVDKLYAAAGTIADAIIGTGHIVNAMIGNIIQSTVYTPGSAGWQINKNGNVEFNSGTFRGAVVFQSGSSGYGNISDKPTSLSGVNSTEGSKLSGIEAGATVGAPSGTNVGSTPATTIETQALGAYDKVSSWVKPGYTLIDGNKIYTGDAYVDTLQIKKNAVTVPVGSYTADPYYLSTDNIKQMVQSAYIETNGNDQPVAITASVLVNLTRSWSIEAIIGPTVYIYRDGTLLYQASLPYSSVFSMVGGIYGTPGYLGSSYTSFSTTILDYPAEGNYYYYVYINPGNITTSPSNVSNRSIVLLECRA